MGSEFRYAYFNCEAALIRIQIPMTFNQSCKPDIELAFFNSSDPLPHYMGLFSHGHFVYMVGGYEGLNGEEVKFEYSNNMYRFDPTEFDKFPAQYIPRYDNKKFAPVVQPCVIRVEDRIYLLSVRDYSIEEDSDDWPFHFQYFDPTTISFEPQQPSPFRIHPGLRCVNIAGHFSLSGYIYVFIMDFYGRTHTFKFNTESLNWEDGNHLLGQFIEKDIPFPFSHRGDIGLSEELPDRTRILVALNGAQPTAYHVHLRKGDIEPKSHRVLRECIFDDNPVCHYSDWAELADIGGGRFCAMHCTPYADVLIYVFSIDFAIEHNLQISKREGVSAHIIFSKKFNLDDVTPYEKFAFTGFCIAFAPPASSSSEDHRKTKGIILGKRKSSCSS